MWPTVLWRYQYLGIAAALHQSYASTPPLPLMHILPRVIRLQFGGSDNTGAQPA